MWRALCSPTLSLLTCLASFQRRFPIICVRSRICFGSAPSEAARFHLYFLMGATVLAMDRIPDGQSLKCCFEGQRLYSATRPDDCDSVYRHVNRESPHHVCPASSFDSLSWE